MNANEPPAKVLHAFGATEPPQQLVGGQGTSWRTGDLVLKPGADPVHEWLAEALHDVSSDEFRLATAVMTRHGTWSCEGWSAAHWLDGTEPNRTTPSTWLQVIEVGRALHRAVAHLRQPLCLDARDDWWAVADRVAWGEHDSQFLPEFAGLSQRLQGALEPLGPPQIVHADLTGNVLFSPTLPPAVIDLSPYWRPAAYAEGIVVADALCWHGAQASLLDQTDVGVAAVARALLFRMATTSQAVSVGGVCADVGDEAQRYHRAAEAIGV